MTIKVMPLKEILKLPSVDSRGNGREWMMGQPIPEYPPDPTDRRATVAETLPRKYLSGKYYEDIRDDTRKHGINSVPVHIGRGRDMRTDYRVDFPEKWNDVTVMGNGHHRVAIIRELGFPNVLVTDRKMESGWNSEKSSAQARRLFRKTRKDLKWLIRATRC